MAVVSLLVEVSMLCRCGIIGQEFLEMRKRNPKEIYGQSCQHNYYFPSLNEIILGLMKMGIPYSYG